MRLGVLCMLLVASVACSSGATLFRQYEYEEEVYLSLDGSAIVYVNTSLAALNALRGTKFDTNSVARLDTAAVRAFYASSSTHITRISQSRRRNRRFVHLRLDVDDIRKLGADAPFAWSTYDFNRDGNQFSYHQTVGAPAGINVVQTGWTGQEVVAFRLHLPSRIRYHNTGREVRGSILEWEQPLADRLRGVPLVLDARMDSRSILYTTLWLFGTTFLVVAAAFCTLIWWVVRKGSPTAEEARL